MNQSDRTNAEAKPKKERKDFVGKRLHHFANYLTRQSERVSLTTKKGVLIAFGVLVSTMSLHIMFDAVNQNDTSLPLKIEQFHSPTLQTTDSLVNYQELKILQAFVIKMDSLKQTQEGRVLYERIILQRPGLMDSINFILHFMEHNNH